MLNAKTLDLGPMDSELFGTMSRTGPERTRSEPKDTPGHRQRDIREHAVSQAVQPLL